MLCVAITSRVHDAPATHVGATPSCVVTGLAVVVCAELVSGTDDSDEVDAGVEDDSLSLIIAIHPNANTPIKTIPAMINVTKTVFFIYSFSLVNAELFANDMLLWYPSRNKLLLKTLHHHWRAADKNESTCIVWNNFLNIL